MSQGGGGHQPMIWPNFPEKIHDNEENCTEEGDASKILQCRSATDLYLFTFVYTMMTLMMTAAESMYERFAVETTLIELGSGTFSTITSRCDEC